jgi:hypothetical protein
VSFVPAKVVMGKGKVSHGMISGLWRYTYREAVIDMMHDTLHVSLSEEKCR